MQVSRTSGNNMSMILLIFMCTTAAQKEGFIEAGSGKTVFMADKVCLLHSSMLILISLKDDGGNWFKKKND